MSKKKKILQKASAAFRRENPAEHSIISSLIGYMSIHIRKTGTTEIAVFANNNGVIYGTKNI